jgi:hypothetical protein
VACAAINVKTTAYVGLIWNLRLSNGRQARLRLKARASKVESRGGNGC